MSKFLTDSTFSGKVNVAGSQNNASALNVRTADGSTGSIGFETGSEITGIITSLTDAMDFRVGDGISMSTARKLRINSNGLDVTGSLTTSGNIILNGSSRALTVTSSNDQVNAAFKCSNNAISRIGFQGSTSTNDYNVSVGADGNEWVAYTSNSVRLRIDTGGNATFAGSLISSGTGGYFRIQNAAGNATYPTYSFQDDSNTGMMSSSSDTLSLVTGGASRMLISNTTVTIGGTIIPGAISFTPANASGDPDKFLCVNGNGVVQYRTGTQVRSDIGAGTSSTTGTVTNVTASTASGLDGLSVSSGTTTPVVGLDIEGMGAYADDFTDGSIDFSQVFVPLCDDDNGGGNKKTNIRDLLAVNDKSLVVLNANFSDDSSTTSYLYVPYNTTSETTSAQYYVHWAAPHTGRFKRVVMQHVYGSMSSSFTTQLKITKNGLSTVSSSELTPTSTNDGGYIEFNPSGSNASFVKGDRFTIAYQKSASSKYWRGVAFSVIIELDKI